MNRKEKFLFIKVKREHSWLQSWDETLDSDVNGSLNILRKYVKDKCIPKLIQSVMDNGGLNTPLRIRVA